ncbi:hypothetical protein [Oceanobacillus senegalensis]|nr:hypothetical protein [Oceanobacillus senegalensis]
MFNLPAETFWLLVPWPFFWLGLGIVMYFKLRKEDLYEEENE